MNFVLANRATNYYASREDANAYLRLMLKMEPGTESVCTPSGEAWGICVKDLCEEINGGEWDAILDKIADSQDIPKIDKAFVRKIVSYLSLVYRIWNLYTERETYKAIVKYPKNW